MLVVIASLFDETARRLVTRRDNCARLLTARDLSTAGWQHSPRAGVPSRAVIDGAVVDASEITGVLNCLSNVDESELSHIVEEDRGYVAAEMNAFLLSWLAVLPCPILNRPTADCLTGPCWRQEKWLSTAARLGIPVCATRRRVSVENHRHQEPMTDFSPVTVTVVGNRCFGEADAELKARAGRLASAAGTALLSVRFYGSDAGARFQGASPTVDLAQDDIADAVLDCFEERVTC